MVRSNVAYLENELADVLRLFGAPEADVTHTLSYADGVFTNVCETDGKTSVRTDACVPADALEYKRFAKRFAKLGLYEALSARSGVAMPWGALTGIRPTKLAYMEQEAGRDWKKLFAQMHVDAENIALVADVLRAQEGIYEKREGNTDLFVSVPFCPSKCVYCSFITADIRYTGKYLNEYVEKLVGELATVGELIGNLKSVYVGGGTPLVLDERQLEAVLRAVAPLRTNGCEYTVEAGRPDVFTEPKLALLKEYGVTRICVNPQSLNDRTLAAIGRNHTAADVLRAYEAAKKYGFDINMDLIAGLTGETYEEFVSSLERAIALDPENITVHSLCLKAGAKLKEETAFLEGGEVSRMIASSRGLLRAAGYEPYYMYRQKYQAGNGENTGWTKKGKACVYNIDIMEEVTDNPAVGANAVSKKVDPFLNRIERYGSPKDIPTYLAKVEEVVRKKRELFFREGGKA